MHVLESAVVCLEPQVAEHAEEMFEVLADPAIYEHEKVAIEPNELLIVRSAVVGSVP